MTRKTKRRGSPAAENTVAEAADRVGPMVHQAADRVEPLMRDAADRVGPLMHGAADRVGPIAQQTAERVAPFAQSTAERLQPYAEQTAAKVGPYARQAADRVGPYAQDAAERIAPYADQAKRQGASYAAQAVDTLAPKVDDAMARVSPAVEDARDRLESDVVPRMSDKLHEAAVATTAAKVANSGKGLAGKKSSSKELANSRPKPKKKSRWVVRAGIVAAVGAAAAFAARKLLGGRDPESEWTVEPTTPYASTTIAEPQASPRQSQADPDAKAASAATPSEPAASPATENVTDQTAPESGTRETTTAETSPYGEGSYVGPEPPTGFTIKGNDRSMKYHLPDSSGYAKTQTDVWFNSAEAAEKAGFSRAQG